MRILLFFCFSYIYAYDVIPDIPKVSRRQVSKGSSDILLSISDDPVAQDLYIDHLRRSCREERIESHILWLESENKINIEKINQAIHTKDWDVLYEICDFLIKTPEFAIDVWYIVDSIPYKELKRFILLFNESPFTAFTIKEFKAICVKKREEARNTKKVFRKSLSIPVIVLRVKESFG